VPTIHFLDANGRLQAAPSDSFTFRPAVYGILIEYDQILLLRDLESQLFCPPGRIVAENEAPAQAVRHYFRRLAEMTPVLGPLLFVENQYREENDTFWQLSVLYYAVERPSTASISFTEDPEAKTRPEWVRLDSLDRTRFQFGYEAVQAGKLRLQL
jgi:hypothetical protein